MNETLFEKLFILLQTINMKKIEKEHKTMNYGFIKRIRSNKNSNVNMLLVCASVIMIRRAIWDFCEIFIFPDSQILSDIICLVVGIVVLLIDDGKLRELL